MYMMRKISRNNVARMCLIADLFFFLFQLLHEIESFIEVN